MRAVVWIVRNENVELCWRYQVVKVVQGYNIFLDGL